MQCYLNGYTPGDPLIEDPDPSVFKRPGELPSRSTSYHRLQSGRTRPRRPDEQLTAFKTGHRPREAGPLQVGQADGVACAPWRCSRRSAWEDRLVDAAYWVNKI